MPVQRACAEGRLPMTLAAKVHAFRPKAQAAIAAEICDGGDPVAVVKARLPKGTARAVDPGKALGTLVAALEVGVDQLEGREGEIRLDLGDLRVALATLKRFAASSKSLRPILRSRRDELERARVGSGAGRAGPEDGLEEEY